MFEEPRNLIVVYKEKDKVSLNQLEKMVNTKDDDKEKGLIVGTEDGTVKIIAWNEKTWLDNYNAGNTGDLDDRILFIGDIKGVDKLIPTLDIKFKEYGVSYGFSGKQAAIVIDSKALINPVKYNEFVKELEKVCNATTVKEKKYYAMSDKKEFMKTYLKSTFALSNPLGIAYSVKKAFDDKDLVRNQQLLFGVANLYQNDLDSFMKN